jgi:hypothetical protein
VEEVEQRIAELCAAIQSAGIPAQEILDAMDDLVVLQSKTMNAYTKGILIAWWLPRIVAIHPRRTKLTRLTTKIRR